MARHDKTKPRTFRGPGRKPPGPFVEDDERIEFDDETPDDPDFFEADADGAQYDPDKVVVTFKDAEGTERKIDGPLPGEAILVKADAITLGTEDGSADPFDPVTLGLAGENPLEDKIDTRVDFTLPSEVAPDTE